MKTSSQNIYNNLVDLAQTSRTSRLVLEEKALVNDFEEEFSLCREMRQASAMATPMSL